MPVLVLLPLVTALYFYIVRRAIPALEVRLQEKPELPILLKLAARKSALDLMSDLAWVSMIVFAAAVAIAFGAGVLVRVDAHNARDALAHLGPVSATIREWKSKLWIGTGALAAATAIFAWIRFRTSERRIKRRLAMMYAAELERLREQQERGKWDNLPPTDEMRELIDVLDERRSQLTSQERERILTTIMQMDYERRMELNWDELWDPKKEMETLPTDLIERIVHFLGGKMPLKAWKTGQRWMTLAAAGCWVLTAIGIGANAAALPAIQERFVTAWDIVVAQNGEASRDGDRTEEPSATPVDSNPVRPNPDDLDRINRLSRALMDFRDTQRVFRAALTGRLGDRFPIERLADLMTAIPVGPVVRTDDWEPLGEGAEAGSKVERAMISRIEQLLKRTDGHEGLDPRLRRALVQCQAALRSDPGGISTVGACNLSRFEDAATGDGTRAVLRNTIRLDYARQLRAALGASRTKR